MHVEAGGRFSEDLRPFVERIGRTALVDNSRFKDLLRRAGDEASVMQRTILVIIDRYRRGRAPQQAQQRDKFDGFRLFWQVSGELGLALIGADSEVLSQSPVEIDCRH